MNVTRISATLMLVVTCGVTGLAMLQPLGGSEAEAAQIVVPNQYENVEAPVGGAIPTGPFRFQQVFAVSQFASLPPGQRTSVSFAMRPDANVTAPVSFTLSDSVIRMSTTNRNPGELSILFSDNVGADEVVVFQGGLSISTANIGPTSGPKNFDLVFQLQKPYTYDPTKGNLIFDVVTAGTASTISQTTDFVAEPGPLFEEIVAFTAGANQATGRFGGNVIRFTFVPEPCCAGLFCIGILTFIGCIRRKH
jgi:hypothetical protein